MKMLHSFICSVHIRLSFLPVAMLKYVTDIITQDGPTSCLWQHKNTYTSSNYMNKVSCFSDFSKIHLHSPECNLRACSVPFVALYSRLLHEKYSFHELFQRPSMNIRRSRPANKIITTWLQREVEREWHREHHRKTLCF
jgi:hypothetical protein